MTFILYVITVVTQIASTSRQRLISFQNVLFLNSLWTPGPESSFLENMRYFRGFVEIQDIIDKAIIQVSMEDSRNIQKRDVEEIKKTDWAVYTQQMPYPCYRKDL